MKAFNIWGFNIGVNTQKIQNTTPGQVLLFPLWNLKEMRTTGRPQTPQGAHWPEPTHLSCCSTGQHHPRVGTWGKPGFTEILESTEGQKSHLYAIHLNPDPRKTALKVGAPGSR